MAIERFQLPPNPRRSRPLPLVAIAALAPNQRLAQAAAGDTRQSGTAGETPATAASIASRQEHSAAHGPAPRFERLVAQGRPALAGTGDA